jgi:hypothetical protein
MYPAIIADADQRAGGVFDLVHRVARAVPSAPGDILARPVYDAIWPKLISYRKISSIPELN